MNNINKKRIYFDVLQNRKLGEFRKFVEFIVAAINCRIEIWCIENSQIVALLMEKAATEGMRRGKTASCPIGPMAMHPFIRSAKSLDRDEICNEREIHCNRQEIWQSENMNDCVSTRSQEFQPFIHSATFLVCVMKLLCDSQNRATNNLRNSLRLPTFGIRYQRKEGEC